MISSTLVAALDRASLVAGAGDDSHRRNRVRLLCLLFVGAAALCGLLAPHASAEPTRPYTGVSFGPDGVGGSRTFASIDSVAVDQGSGEVFVYDARAGKVYKFGPAGEPLPFSALEGSNAIEGIAVGGSFYEANTYQIAVAPPGAPGGTAGDIYVANNSNLILIYAATGVRLGELDIGVENCGVATNGAGHLFVGDFGLPSLVREFVPSANPPVVGDETNASVASLPNTCNVAVDEAGGVYATNYLGQKVAKLEPISAGSPTLISPGAPTIAVDSGTNALLANRGELVAEYEPDGTLLETFGAGQLTGSSGVALDSAGEKAYVGDGGSGKVKVFGAVAVLPEVTTNAATGVTTATAELHGTVDPEEVPLEDCSFEYGLVTEVGFPGEAPCDPPAASIPVDSSNHAVRAAVSGLQSNATYRFRLTASNAGAAASGQAEAFTTTGPPELSETRATEATQTSANLEATIDPRGFAVTYAFEWGPTTAYGNTAGVGSIPAGASSSRVTTPLSGLEPGTTYHYRVVATNGGGRRTIGSDEEVETLDACGLAAHRCFEMVSPRDPGPVATARASGTRQLGTQAAGAGPGALAYIIEYGLPGATRGAEVLYRADRSTTEWGSDQLSPPLAAQNKRLGDSGSDWTLAMSNDLSCSLVASDQPLTLDPAVRQIYEAGRLNLYRRGADGAYTAITNLVPTNLMETDPEAKTPNRVLGYSQNCNTVLFESEYKFPGIPVIARSEASFPAYIYEWHDGTLRSVANLPGPSGPTPVETPFAGTGGTNPNNFNVVSEDGSRLFLAGKRLIPGNPANPAEVGKVGLFVREVTGGHISTRDISGSETTTPDTGATYQYATPNGSHVFFTANAGLTQRSSTKGTDLYEYDFATDRLTDRSIGPSGEPAEVAGVLGISADGTHVYFASPSQLLPGRGSTAAENAAAHTLSVYEESDHTLGYVGRVRQAEVASDTARSVVDHQQFWTSRVSGDGRYLLFETSANVTGYESGSTRAMEAYLYDAATDETVCISCRPDRQPSIASLPSQTAEFIPLPSGNGANPLHEPRSLVVSAGQPRVFFTSLDRLAPGGADGRTTLYEWAHGQVSTVVAEPPGYPTVATAFADASADGSDLYFLTPQALNWEDTDGRASMYDARIGGGFQRPPVLSTCEAAREGSCNGASTSLPAASQVASESVTGSGNVTPKKKHAKHKKKKHAKHKKKHAKHKKKKHAKHKKKKHAKHKKNTRSTRGAGR